MNDDAKYMELAQRYYRAQHSVAKYFQFRDREARLDYGVTATQCYVIFELGERPQMTMSELAKSIGLGGSSMTRCIDELVALEYVERRDHPTDRRVCLIQLTRDGFQMLETMRTGCVKRDYDILMQIDPKSRQEVVRSAELLAEFLANRAREEGRS